MGTPLHVACLNNQYTKVKPLLSTESLRVEERTREGLTALMLCSKLNNVRLVRLLLENKARLNAVDKVGATALMISSEQGNLQVVNVLVKAGADLEVEDFFLGGGESALYLAAEQERLEVVGPLMRAGSNPCSSREGGMTPLHTAARHMEDWGLYRRWLVEALYCLPMCQGGRTASSVFMIAMSPLTWLALVGIVMWFDGCSLMGLVYVEGRPGVTKHSKLPRFSVTWKYSPF